MIDQAAKLQADMAAFTERLASDAEATGDPVCVESARILRRMLALMRRQTELNAEHAAIGREIAELNLRMQTIGAAMFSAPAEGVTLQ